MQMNDKIRARLQQLDDTTIGNMANDLQATRITDDVKGVGSGVKGPGLTTDKRVLMVYMLSR